MAAAGPLAARVHVERPPQGGSLRDPEGLREGILEWAIEVGAKTLRRTRVGLMFNAIRLSQGCELADLSVEVPAKALPIKDSRGVDEERAEGGRERGAGGPPGH